MIRIYRENLHIVPNMQTFVCCYCHLFPGLAWDNYDVNVETLDGKNTLHSTVGICYQSSTTNSKRSENVPVDVLQGRKRRLLQEKINQFLPSIHH